MGFYLHFNNTTDGAYTYLKHHTPPTIKVTVYGIGQDYTIDGKTLEIDTTYNDGHETITLENEEEISLDFMFGDMQWVKGTYTITATLKEDETTILTETVQLYHRNPTIHETINHIQNEYSTILKEKGIPSDSYDGLLTMVKKTNLINDGSYEPPLDGTDPTVTLAEGYDFTTDYGYGGGYHQVGFLSDGFPNWDNWELIMTLQTSQYNGGFILLTNPYGLQTCTSYTNKMDCILKNGADDTLQWLDGYIKRNSLQGSLNSTGVTYTRNSTVNFKLEKIGTTIKYYENNTLKGTFTWNNIANQGWIYIGIATWGDSGSVNRFNNVKARRITV